MNEKIPIGSRVETIHSGHEGIVIGKTTTYERHVDTIFEAEVVIVLLKKGFWSEDRKNFVTSLCIHPSNITIINKEKENHALRA